MCLWCFCLKCKRRCNFYHCSLRFFLFSFRLHFKFYNLFYSHFFIRIVPLIPCLNTQLLVQKKWYSPFFFGINEREKRCNLVERRNISPWCTFFSHQHLLISLIHYSLTKYFTFRCFCLFVCFSPYAIHESILNIKKKQFLYKLHLGSYNSIYFL